MNPEKSKSAIPAMDVVARAFYCWLLAMDMFEKVLRGSAPKRESLVRAETEHQVSGGDWGGAGSARRELTI